VQVSRPALIASGGLEAASTAGQESGATICRSTLRVFGLEIEVFGLKRAGKDYYLDNRWIS